MPRALDTLISTLFILILLLLTTGGLKAEKLELSQVNAFAIALLALAAIRRKTTKQWFPKWIEIISERVLNQIQKRPELLVWGASVFYVFIQTWVLVWRYDSFHANAYDLSYVDQPLWATTRVGFLHSSLGLGNSYLGEHFSPILALVGLIYRIWDSVYALFFFQSIVLVSSAILTYKLARLKKVRESYAAVIAILVLLYHPLRAANQFDFREDNLFVPILLGTLMAFEQGRWWLFWLLTLLTWTVKENAPIFTALIGLGLAFAYDRKQKIAKQSFVIHGIALVVLSAGVFYIVNHYVTPHFAGGTSKTRLAVRLRDFGSTPTEILIFLVHEPFSFMKKIGAIFLQKNAIKYTLGVILPFAYFANAAPVAFTIAALGLALNIFMGINTIGYHYECLLIPFLFYTLVFGIARDQNKVKPVHLLLLALGFLLFYGRSPIHNLRQWKPDAHDRFVKAELAKIPTEASVSTHTALHPHLTHRKDVFLMPPPKPVDYYVADVSPDLERYGSEGLLQDIEKIDAAKYEKILDQDNLKIWKLRK